MPKDTKAPFGTFRHIRRLHCEEQQRNRGDKDNTGDDEDNTPFFLSVISDTPVYSTRTLITPSILRQLRDRVGGNFMVKVHNSVSEYPRVIYLPCPQYCS